MIDPKRLAEIEARADAWPYDIGQAKNDVEWLASELRARDAKLVAWRRAAQVITPGGSEYCDPEGVYRFNSNFKEEYVEAMCRVAKLERAAIARDAEVARLRDLLTDIGDVAHAKSTGPAVEDGYWEIREMAYHSAAINPEVKS